jgi:hypothetical protein
MNPWGLQGGQGFQELPEWAVGGGEATLSVPGT